MILCFRANFGHFSPDGILTLGTSTPYHSELGGPKRACPTRMLASVALFFNLNRHLLLAPPRSEEQSRMSTKPRRLALGGRSTVGMLAQITMTSHKCIICAIDPFQLDHQRVYRSLVYMCTIEKMVPSKAREIELLRSTSTIRTTGNHSDRNYHKLCSERSACCVGKSHIGKIQSHIARRHILEQCA